MAQIVACQPLILFACSARIGQAPRPAKTGRGLANVVHPGMGADGDGWQDCRLPTMQPTRAGCSPL